MYLFFTLVFFHLNNDTLENTQTLTGIYNGEFVEMSSKNTPEEIYQASVDNKSAVFKQQIEITDNYVSGF